jgi:tetratricopeptide (TPR) repeat protein
MVSASNAHKAEANSLFTSGKYDAAINKYNEALAVCPIYLDYELSVLHSNVAACHLKLEEWKDATASATSALGSLDKLEREIKEKEEAEEAMKKEEEDAVELEIISPGAKAAGPAIQNPTDDEAETARRKRQEDIARIRAKALMRRARARSELGGWTNLEGALGDYKKLAEMPANLGAADKKIVQSQLRALPPRVKEAQEKETTEMWGKLKDLGNGLLKPFGLSTENFKMVQDEKTGGYSMNFQGGGEGK